MDIEETRENNKKFGEKQHAAVTSSQNRLLEEHSAAFRWLMASLLAINSAGLLVLKDGLGSMSVWKALAGVSFYAGIVSAFAIAWFAQQVVRASLPLYSKQIAFWATVHVTGEFDPETHAQVIQEPTDVYEKSKMAPRAGWISLAAFTIGLICIGIAAYKTLDISKIAVDNKASVSSLK
jgi:hypothetical protein